MNAYRTKNLRLVLVVLISIGIWGCAGKPFDPPQTGEIPKGPGVFSKGDDGVVLYDSKKNRSDRRTAAKGNSGRPAVPSSASDYAEFEAYQQFKAWKKSAVGTNEYEEFQQWRQWQQYRMWKQNQ